MFKCFPIVKFGESMGWVKIKKIYFKSSISHSVRDKYYRKKRIQRGHMTDFFFVYSLLSLFGGFFFIFFYRRRSLGTNVHFFRHIDTLNFTGSVRCSRAARETVFSMFLRDRIVTLSTQRRVTCAITFPCALAGHEISLAAVNFRRTELFAQWSRVYLSIA